MNNEINKEEGGEAFKEMQRIEALKARLVPSHKKDSRDVTEADIDRVIEEAKILYEICFTPVGDYNGAFAMAHSQIDDKDPMKLFVTRERSIIINAKITRHSNYTVDSEEACVSFPDRPQIIVPRWHKIEVEYMTIMVDPEDKDKFKLSSVQKESLSGRESFVWQHEIDHQNSQFIYQ